MAVEVEVFGVFTRALREADVRRLEDYLHTRPGEKQGIIPHHEWKLATHGVVWTPGETVVASIGQGYVLVTPLQLAVMTARLASGTKAVTPSLQTVDGVPEFAELYISPAALRIVHKGMFEVTNGSLGTARAHNLPSRLGGMAGKTGTVQVLSLIHI